MNISNESHSANKYYHILAAKLRKSLSPKRGITLNDILYYAVCINLFVYVVIKFLSRGAFESENLIGYGRILFISDFVLLAFMIFNYQLLSRLPSLVSLVFIWLLWMVTTCLLLFSYGTQDVVSALLEVSYCPLLFLLFFVSIRQKPERFHKTNIIFFLLLAFTVPLFILVLNFQNRLSVSTFSLLNDVYFLLLLLPWVLLYPKIQWKSIGILVIIIAVLLSMKRTALLSLVVALVIYFLLERIRVRRLIDGRFLFGVFAFAAIMLPLYSYIDTQTDSYLLSRISSSSDDKGSGRVDIYNEVIKLQNESNISSWVIGHGHNRVVKSTSEFVSAHNDWLEVLFDYGLVGLVLYSCFHLLLLRKILRLLKLRSYYGPPMAASYALFFLISLSSHLVIYSSYFSYLMAFWGSIFAISESGKTLRHQTDQFTRISS